MRIIGIKTKIVYYPVWQNMDKITANTKTLAKAFHLECKDQSITNDTNINIYCTGTSGLTMAICFRFALIELGHSNMRICYTRKEGETKHDSPLSYTERSGINIIIDDFISTGATVDYIVSKHIDTTFDYIILDDVVTYFTSWPINNIIFNVELYKNNILNKLDADRFIIESDELKAIEYFG